MSSHAPTADPRGALIEAFTREMLGIVRLHRLERVTDAAVAMLSIEDAYRVQSRVLAERVAGGEHIVGWKVGCTSPSIQQQFGLTQPICGRLLEPHIDADGARHSASRYVDCAVEAEMVFRMERDLAPGMNEEELRAAIASVHPGIELHNYRFWYGSPTSQELIASNGIHAGLVIGAAHDTATLDMNAERMQLVVNGRVEAEGVGSDVMGGPLRSLRWLAGHAAERGEQVRRGDLVIPGSAVKLVRVSAGDAIEARFGSIGSCHAYLI
jgi:2-keto-4-pentenoate hydratase